MTLQLCDKGEPTWQFENFVSTITGVMASKRGRVLTYMGLGSAHNRLSHPRFIVLILHDDIRDIFSGWKGVPLIHLTQSHKKYVRIKVFIRLILTSVFREM